MMMLAGCGDATAPTHSVDGTWRGVIGDQSITLSLTMHSDQTVTGTGIDSSASAGVKMFPVRGTVAGPTVVLVFDPVALTSGFSGKFMNDQTLTGSVDFPSVTGDLHLVRQPGRPQI
ncbi:MAG TPA: hypothetical protein VNW46_05385 [Gemmatimonadaceae bacterium]|jgi:hypothetical protein|nr:hypothetical protein [Gemmatimonadaceae bacterium]